MLAGVLLNAAAQLLLKAGGAQRRRDLHERRQCRALAQRGRTGPAPGILGGLACYAISVVVWIVALSRVEVSIAYPMLSIGYVVNAVARLVAVRRDRSNCSAGSASRHHRRRDPGGAQRSTT